MTFSRDLRYRPYQDWTTEEKNKIKANVNKSPWHANYHIEPKSGLLNDPNGFSFFNGKFHLFYQNWPFGAAHGLKQWVHTESDDLVHFTETNTRLLPDNPNDSHGCYSGSAYEIGSKLFLFYTGNVRDENWVRTPLQVGAWMDKEGNISKMDTILINQPSDVTEHFRDPQIFSYQNQFYVIVGTQSLDKEGFIKVYKAEQNDVNNWTFIGNLDFDNKGHAYMIECPNLVFIDNKPVLIYSPQGISHDELDYNNIYPNAYKIGQSFDTSIPKMNQVSSIQNLDYGFEAYATQAFNAPDGRALAVSWIGLPEIDYPTDRFDYQGALSLVKELTLKDGKLYQYPVDSISTLRSKQQEFGPQEKTSNCYELELHIPKEEKSILKLFADNKGNGLSLTVDSSNGFITLDRSQVGEVFSQEYGTIRKCPIENKAITLNIFVDNSIVEIFINKGEKVMTSRVFPEQDQSGISIISGNITGHYFELN